MKRLELKNKFSCKTITKSTGPSFYRNGRAACPHRSLIAVVRNNSLTRQKKNWEQLLCGCFMKDFRSKHICFSLTSSKAYAENFSDIFHKRSTWMPYSRKTILKSERSASINNWTPITQNHTLPFDCAFVNGWSHVYQPYTTYAFTSWQFHTQNP